MYFLSVPGSVQSLQVSNLNSNPSPRPKVSWNKPHGGNAIDRYYVVWYEENKIIGSKYVNHTAANANYQLTITNLKASTKYRVVVYATNSAGNGSKESVNFTTGSLHLI